jgi:hypothetical protein
MYILQLGLMQHPELALGHCMVGLVKTAHRGIRAQMNVADW